MLSEQWVLDKQMMMKKLLIDINVLERLSSVLLFTRQVRIFNVV